ncbi:MAG: gamma-glutamylcyclotransferase family protein [Actinomycetota bacterium]
MRQVRRHRDADHRLATYGSLAPGRSNHHVVADLTGEWLHGTVRGNLRHDGWGADLGFPGIVLDPHGPLVEVQVLESRDLPARWNQLDEFEGPGYRRVVTVVSTDRGDVHAQIYALADAVVG